MRRVASFNLPTIGEDRNNWGTKLNESLQYLDEARAAVVTDIATTSAAVDAAAETAETAVTSAATALAAASAAAEVADDALARAARTFDARDYGTVGDGVADDRAAINAALTAAAAAGGGEVFLAPGSYRVTGSIDVPSRCSLRGAGRGITKIILGTATATVVDLTGGSLGSLRSTLTVDAAVGARTLTVNSTSGVAAGDWLLLMDNSVPDPAYLTRLAGEMVYVQTVTSGTVLTIRNTSATEDGSTLPGVQGAFADTLTGLGPYTTANSAKLYQVTLSVGQSVQDLTILNPSPGTGNSKGIQASYTLGTSVKNVEIYGMDGTGIEANYVVGLSVRDSWIHDLVDDSVNGRFGYGINISGASQDVTVANCLFDRLRHGFTTNGSTAGGIPRRITVSNCRAFQTHHTSFDTHGAGNDILFTGCVSIESAQYGFTNRARNVLYQGCRAVRPGNYGFNIGDLPARNVSIIGCTVVGALAAGIRVAGEGIHGVTIADSFVNGAATNGIVLGYGNQRQSVINTKIFNIGSGGDIAYGITFAAGALGTVNSPNTLISGNTFVLNEGYTATWYNAAVNIPNSALTSVVVSGCRVAGIYTGSTGYILDVGTTTVLFDNARLDGTAGGYVSVPNATTTALTSLTSIVNKLKRRGVSVFNSTTGKPVWAAADGAAGVWVDATGATVHTPV